MARLGQFKFPPPLNLQIFFNCVSAQTWYRWCSLNPTFCTGKRQKLYTNFTFFFNFWGIRRHTLCRALPCATLGDFRPALAQPLLENS